MEVTRLAEPVLVVRDLRAGYGPVQILFGVSLEVNQGEVVALLGRNGAGKTTTMKAIMGILPPRAGQVSLHGRMVAGMRPSTLARAGMGYVPEDRRIFPDLTVRENLAIAEKIGPNGLKNWMASNVIELFPLLQTLLGRKGGLLSGGEQQLLAVARALVGNPSVLLLDEPTEGLAPVMVKAVEDVVLQLKKAGATVLLAEQNLGFASRVADRGYVLQQGQGIMTGSMAECAASEAVARSLAV